MSGILGLWDALIETVGLLAIVVFGICLMVGAVEPSRAFVRIGAAVGCMVLLVEVPAIIVGIWYSLSFWQHIGIIALMAMIGLLVLRGGSSRNERRASRH